MYRNLLVKIKSAKIKRTIAQTLKLRRIDDEQFEAVISNLLVKAHLKMTPERADEILMLYRLKTACEITAHPQENFLAVISKTCRSFSPLKKHLYKAKGCRSVFDLNILDLSSLSTFSDKIDKLKEMLDDFTTPISDAEPAVCKYRCKEAAIWGRLEEEELSKEESTRINISQLRQRLNSQSSTEEGRK